MVVNKKLLSVAKILIAATLLWWVLSRVGVEEILAIYRNVSPLYLLLALLAFNLSQCISAERMRFYYDKSGYPLRRGFALVMHYVSMFFNVLVPGGVGGDAYRIYLLKQAGNVDIPTGIRLQLSNRASGLLLILLMILLLLAVSSVTKPWWVMVCIPLVMLTVMLGYFMLIIRILKEPAEVASEAMIYSLAIQVCGLLAVSLLCAGLGAEAYLLDYLLLYLIALIAGMIPISVGGLGIREVTFYYGASLIHLLGDVPISGEMGVALSLGMFALTLVSSLFGVFALGAVKQMIARDRAMDQT